MKKITFIGFDGHYGGDEYERDLAAHLSSYKTFTVEELRLPRMGGIGSLLNLFRLIYYGYTSKNLIVRPFGIPIYKKNMTVIIHHLDWGGSPYYTKLIESFDIIALYVFRLFSRASFIFVATYWQKTLARFFGGASFVIYNFPPKKSRNNSINRKQISEKYHIPLDTEWIFFGSGAEKKGASRVAKRILEMSDGISPDHLTLIQSNRKMYVKDILLDVWIDAEDYADFLEACDLVVANSQFAEGWCRVLHEAAIAGTPVIGSGRGGMGELLEIINGRSSYSEDEICNWILTPDRRITPDLSNFNCIDKRRQNEIHKWLVLVNAFK